MSTKYFHEDKKSEGTLTQRENILVSVVVPVVSYEKDEYRYEALYKIVEIRSRTYTILEVKECSCRIELNFLSK